tara:strand:+ start:2739 stop:3074 length:336 start_codon:yes stop_codon:yes gene_type:complete
MKLTKTQLKQIIKEELNKVLTETYDEDAANLAYDILYDFFEDQKGSNTDFIFDELKNVARRTKPGIDDASIREAIKWHTRDQGYGARLIEDGFVMIDGEREQKWKLGNWGY